MSDFINKAQDAVQNTIGDMDGHERSSAIKVTMSSFIAAAVAAVFILVGFFVIDRFSATAQTGVEYWTEKALTGAATFLVMLSTANICEEVRKRKDTSYNARLQSIDKHYQTILGNGEVDDLEEFITNTNIANKYRAYVLAVKKRIRRATALKREKARIAAEKMLLATPAEVWEDVRRVKYHKITYSQLFEGAQDVSQNDDDNDLNIHRARYTLKKLAWKIVWIIAFGAVATDIAFSMAEFDKNMLVTLVLKVCVLLIAAYSGLSFGYSMLERTKVVLRRKTRVLSQFRAREDNTAVPRSERFVVAVPRDIYVEKVKALYAEKTPAPAPTACVALVPATTPTTIYNVTARPDGE